MNIQIEHSIFIEVPQICYVQIVLASIKATAELEKILKNEYLDMEFAIDDDFKPHLFQVRKITTHSKWNKYISKNIDDALKEIKSVVKSRFKPIADAYGNTTVLGQMLTGIL